MEIRKGMYGLPQAGILANKLLTTRLATHGYHPCPITPGLWKHETRPITFVLIVADFGIKVVGDDDAEHIINAIKEHHPVTIDKKGEIFAGIKLKWN